MAETRSLVQEARDKLVGALVGANMGAQEMTRLVESIDQERANLQLTTESKQMLAKEGLADLEMAFEDIGWRDLTTYFGIWKFNRASIRRITALARIMYIVNPLIKRAVTVQELYVWGAGCTIKAEDPKVDEVLQDFFKSVRNERVIGQGEEGWTQREREQRIDGNTFFAFFHHPVTGAVRVRLLPYDLVQDIIYNPDDGKEVWFYRRSLANISGAIVDTDFSGTVATTPDQQPQPEMLYPDIDYNPLFKPGLYQTRRDAGAQGLAINWNVRILHVKTGSLSSMKFGLPELYSALNWATAYKKILENFATILAAYARVAMKITGVPGKKGVAAAKSQMGTAVNSGQFTDTNPPTNTGSWMAMSGNVDIAPIKTAHSTTAPDEARALRSMVASGSDLPEHFFGDSDVGNLATSETLDRPTELKMIARQQMWREIIQKMARYAIQCSAVAMDGKLRKANYTATLEPDAFDRTMVTVTVTPPEKGSLRVAVEFPNITERAVTERVRALVNAATLNGRKAEGLFPERKFLFKLMLDALGRTDSEEQAEKYYPQEVRQGFIDPADEAENSRMEAEGRKEIGDAALLTAENKDAKPDGQGNLPLD